MQEMQNLPTHINKLEESILSKLENNDKQILLVGEGEISFRKYDNDDKKELARELVKLSYFVGIKEPLTIEQIKMIVNYLVSEHPTLTLSQINQAFMMACSGKLETEFEHFQNFSPIYISKIINAYYHNVKAAKLRYKHIEEREQREKENQLRVQNYDTEKGLISTLLREYQNFQKNRYQEINDAQEVSIYCCLQLCVQSGLFKRYNPKKDTPKEYMERFFYYLEKSQGNDIESKIETYVQSNF